MSSFTPVDPSLIDVQLPESGYSAARQAEDKPDEIRAACGSAARDFPKALWIDPKDWADKARDNDTHKTWPINYLDRYTNQNPTHECTTHSLRANFEACRNRQRGVSFADGPKKGFRYPESAEYGSVWMSIIGTYAIANPGQWGGANVRQVMEIAVQNGMLPDKLQPREYGFEHAIQGTAGQGNNNQSSGPWITERQFPAGWKETAKHFRPLEVIFPGSWEEAVCLVLHGIVVSVGRSGHAVPWARWNVASSVMEYPDSYDVTRADSAGVVRSAWQGAFAIATVTAPDDWMHPAGVA